MRQFLSFFVATLALTALLGSCGPAPTDGWQELDLTKYNIPLKIKGPDSINVKSTNLSGVIQDVVITSPDAEYALQILASQATTNDLSRLKADQLELVRDNRYFERVVEEEPLGFIFENKIDTTSIFGFRYIVYQGDREFVFQNPMQGTYNLDQTRALYEAVKQQ